MPILEQSDVSMNLHVGSMYVKTNELCGLR